MRELDSHHWNHLLAALIEAGCENLHSQLELVPMTQGDVLHESNGRLRHTYFPTTAIVSLLSMMEDGESDEIALIGNEGMVGAPLFMAGETTPIRVVVRCAGHAYRLNSQVLQEKCNRSGDIQHLVLRYTKALLTQFAQTAACNSRHSANQRFCRWLLLCLDRLPSNEIQITQEEIAGILGVRRETITQEMGELQATGLIRHRRSRIIVIDRPNLEARVCECYRCIRREFTRLQTGNKAPKYNLGLGSTFIPGRHLQMPQSGFARVEAAHF